ncbi:MAG: PAS domain S-box protein, partial [Geobacter sp.]|nr:PAS domain S-box protein [Geobacter sp.]
ILYRLNMKTGSYDYLSPAFERITGYPFAAFKTNGLENLRKLVHPEDRDVINAVDTALRKRTGNSVNINYEFRLKRADGSYCWLHDYTTACFNDQGELECFFGSAYDLTSRKEMEAALRQTHDELELRVAERTAELAAANEQIKLMSFQLIRAEELERGRIAAELHDQVGQSLLLAKMNLDLLANDIASKKERRTAANISALLSSSIDDIRTLTFGLRLPLLETAGLEAALQWLCAKFYDDFNLQIDFSCRSKPPQISSEKRYSLFQAIRELLLNVAKHGKVNHAQLSLGSVAGELTVAIIDKGIGFEPSAYRNKLSSVASFGIFNVQQRIKQLGGSFEIVSASGKGTTAWIRIPLDNELQEGL